VSDKGKFTGNVEYGDKDSSELKISLIIFLLHKNNEIDKYFIYFGNTFNSINCL